MSIMHKNHSLKKLNSFGVDVRASLFASPETIEELQTILEKYDYSQFPTPDNG